MSRRRNYAVTYQDTQRWEAALAEGATVTEVAERFGFAVATVRTYTRKEQLT